MAEGFSVASRLTFTTNAVQIVGDLLRSFERLDKVIASTQGNLNRLSTELGSLNRGGGGLNRSVEAIERLSRVRLSPELVSGMDRVARSANDAALAARQIGRNAGGGGKGTGAGGRRGGGGAASGDGSFSHHDLLNASMGATMVGDAGMGFFGGALKAELEIREQLAMLRTNTKIDDAGIEKARSVAERITKLTPGSTMAENLHHIVDAFTLMGDLNEALEGAPAFAQAAYLLKNMPGVHKGDTSFAAAQAIELMQRQTVNGHVDMGSFNRELAAMVQVAYGTGGRVDGGSYLGFAKQSRVGGMVANEQYLNRDLPALLIALGGNRAGTGDAAVWNQFVTGKMTANAFDALQKAGIVDKNADWQHGQVTDMEKHLRDASGFGANRVQWVRDVFLGPNGILKQNGVDQNNKLAVSQFLSKWNSRQTGLGFMSEMVLGMPNIDKEAQKIGDTTQNPLDILRKNDPAQAIREFKAAENDLMVALGKEALGPAIEALKGLTDVVRQLGDVAKAHPDLAKDIVLVGGGLSILATGAGEAAMVLYLGAPIITGIRALAAATTLFAVGTPAGLALTALAAGVGALAWALKGIDAPEIKKDMLDSLRNRTLKPGDPHAWVPPPGSQPPARGSPLLQKEGYLMRPPARGGGSMQPVVLTLDGREIGRGMMPYMASNTPWSGKMGVDLKQSPMFGGPAFAT